MRRLRTAIDPDRFEKLLEVVYALAMAGDLQAAKLIMSHLLPQSHQVRSQFDASFSDPEAALASHEFRRAGASWSQIDQEIIKHLGRLVEEQKQFEASLKGGPQR